MTQTVETLAAPDASSRSVAAEELIEVDPGTLIIGSNVRSDTHPDAKEFAASIKARGVLEVITAYRDEAGGLVVVRGQRRAVVAARVGTPTGTVTVRVMPSPAEADRITDQLAENVHRAAMHAGEVRDAIDQLSLLGVSAAQITKRTALPRTTVDAALIVARSQGTRARMDEAGLTLDQAAVFAEFDGDDEATDALTDALTSTWRSLDHVAQQLRDQRAEDADVAVEAARLRAEGLPALDPAEVPSNHHELRMSGLRTASGDLVPQEAWPSIPGAAVVVSPTWRYAQPDRAAGDDDNRSDNRNDSSSDQADGDDDEDYDDHDDMPLSEESDDRVRVFVPVWICTDPAAAGLHRRQYGTAQSATQDTEPVSAEEAEEAREAKRVERRRVIDNNKAWRSAQTVRREWLRGFVARKTPPAGAEFMVCEALLMAPSSLDKAMRERHPQLGQLLGYERPGRLDGHDLIARVTTPKHATMLALAAVVTAWEDSTDVHTWRSPAAWDRCVMRALIGWGYGASDVEKLLCPAPPQAADEPDTQRGPDHSADPDGTAGDTSVNDGAEIPTA